MVTKDYLEDRLAKFEVRMVSKSYLDAKFAFEKTASARRRRY